MYCTNYSALKRNWTLNSYFALLQKFTIFKSIYSLFARGSPLPCLSVRAQQNRTIKEQIEVEFEFAVPRGRMKYINYSGREAGKLRHWPIYNEDFGRGQRARALMDDILWRGHTPIRPQMIDTDSNIMLEERNLLICSSMGGRYS